MTTTDTQHPAPHPDPAEEPPPAATPAAPPREPHLHATENAHPDTASLTAQRPDPTIRTDRGPETPAWARGPEPTVRVDRGPELGARERLASETAAWSDRGSETAARSGRRLGQARRRETRAVGEAVWRVPLLVGADLAALVPAAVGRAGPLLVPLVLAAVALLGGYRYRLRWSAGADLPRLAFAVLAGAAALALADGVLPAGWAAGAGWRGDGLVLALAGTALLVAVLRGVMAYPLVRFTRRYHAGRPTLVVAAAGDTAIGRLLRQTLHRHPEYGLRPVHTVHLGRWRIGTQATTLTACTPEVGGVGLVAGDAGARVRDAVARVRPGCVVLVGVGALDGGVLAGVRASVPAGCRVVAVLSMVPGLLPGARRELVDGLAVVPVRLSGGARPALGWWVKRLADVVLAAAALVLLAPVLAVCAVLVRAVDGPGVLFRQERVGRGGRPFLMLKFRSLRPAGAVESATRWSVESDPRLGRLGRVLRATALDELPQLVNVLRGDMSLVGPRPERPYFVARFARQVPGYLARHRVRPGMTGWAQVHGLRGDTSIADRVRYDNAYIDGWSLGLDLRILAGTVRAIARAGHG